MIIDIATDKSTELIKSKLRRVESPLITQMPFAKNCRRVTGGLQQLGKRDFSRVQSQMVRGMLGICVDHACDPCSMGVSTCQQARPRRAANNPIGVKISEPQTLGGQPIQVRRIQPATVATSIAISHVIGQDNDKIGWFLSGSRLGLPANRLRKHRQQQTTCGNPATGNQVMVPLVRLQSFTIKHPVPHPF